MKPQTKNKKNTNLRQSKTVKGMRDFLPKKARKKKFIESLCKQVFEKYGFAPIETPIVENLELLTAKGSAGEEIGKEIYSFKDKGNRDLGLRFDLTVPLARVIATNPQLKMPFKRYQIGRVYRYDQPQAKRYREFTQADIDIIGTNSKLADFECIAIAIKIMQQLTKDFYIIINSRKLLESIAKANDVTKEQIENCFRALDKLDKIGVDGVKRELNTFGISNKILNAIQETDLNKIETELKEKNISIDGLNELNELLELLKDNNLNKFIKVDLSLARGLAYYTSTVFEIKVKKGPSVGAGGRYNKLISLYGGKDLPAVGISFGIDRLVDTVDETLKLATETKVFVLSIGNTKKEALKNAQLLREKGINVEIDLLNRSISKNLDYAGSKGIKFALIIGEKELKMNKFTLKNLESGESELLDFEKILNKIRK